MELKLKSTLVLNIFITLADYLYSSEVLQGTRKYFEQFMGVITARG